MRRMFIVGLIALGFHGAASGSTVTGKISRLVTRASDGLQIVEIEGSRSAKPACATYNYFIIRDEKSDAGKSQYAMLMAAFLADRQIGIEGSGRCMRWGDGEDIEGVIYLK